MRASVSVGGLGRVATGATEGVDRNPVANKTGGREVVRCGAVWCSVVYLGWVGYALATVLEVPS